MTKSPPKPDPDRELRRAEKREQDIRAALAKVGGVTGPVMSAILRFFGRYAENPRPELFLQVIQSVANLQLMALPEHRNGLAGAIAAVVMLHPEHQDAWRQGKVGLIMDGPVDAHTCSRLAKVIEAAEAIAPPLSDEEVTKPGHIEYLWMTWIVAREEAVLQRVIRMAHRHDAVGESALQLLHAHGTMPEVQNQLMQVLQARLRGIPHYKGAPPNVPVEDVRALQAMLVAQAAEQVGTGTGTGAGARGGPAHPRKHLVLIGWLPGETGGFLVVTTDGKKPAGYVETWRQRKVVVRKAKPAEMQAHRALIDAQEAP